jgi:hypothetical protein
VPEYGEQLLAIRQRRVGGVARGSLHFEIPETLRALAGQTGVAPVAGLLDFRAHPGRRLRGLIAQEALSA